MLHISFIYILVFQRKSYLRLINRLSSKIRATIRCILFYSKKRKGKQKKTFSLQLLVTHAVFRHLLSEHVEY